MLFEACEPNYSRRRETSGSSFLIIILIYMVRMTLGLACTLAAGAQQNVATARKISDFPGTSIVERLQAAIRACGSEPCEIHIPPGSYDSSPVSNWKNHDTTGASVGVLLPSNVEIRGAGKGRTTIRVSRSATDPPATLFANANRSNRNIRLSNMSLVWTDSAISHDWVSIFICHGCDRLEIDHVSFEGNPNKFVNLLDGTGSSIHDNDFLLHSTSFAHGDNALALCRFDEATPVDGAAGVVRDNHFTQTGDYISFSMLVLCQSGVFVHSNVFEAHPMPQGYATAIETGQDNTGHLPENVRISDNVFHWASIAHGSLNNYEVSGNSLDHGDIYIAEGDGSSGSSTEVTIADNELHFGRIAVGGFEHTFSGRFVVTHNRVFDGNIGTGNSFTFRDVQVTDNFVRNSANMSGIDCNACSLIRGNVVREVGQKSQGDVFAGYSIGGTVSDVSDNVYIDEQHDYEAGTICSVAKPSSVLCLPTGSSRWVLLRGGEWGFGWTNRTLFTEHGRLPIRGFVSTSLLELDQEMPAIPEGTHYHLYRTTYNAFELNSAVIERFANNLAISPGGYRHAAVQEDGTVRIHSLYGNVFRPYSCAGKCTVDYRSTLTPAD